MEDHAARPPFAILFRILPSSCLIITIATALITSIGAGDIERAQALARTSDAERIRFHSRYVFPVTDPTVTQVEVITEFRRAVLITEEHIRKGDWMFSRSVPSAIEALRATSGTVEIVAQLRFNPLNVYVTVPSCELALGPAGRDATLSPIDTDVEAQYSTPFKTRGKSTTTTIVGATLRAELIAAGIGQNVRSVGVLLEGREDARVEIDFSKLD